MPSEVLALAVAPEKRSRPIGPQRLPSMVPEFIGQPVEVRRIVAGTAETFQVSIAQIVGEDDDEVRLPFGRGCDSCQVGEQKLSPIGLHKISLAQGIVHPSGQSTGESDGR